ncbi:hypothetical protein ACLB2K_058717 [Fragaria x ananassa]
MQRSGNKVTRKGYVPVLVGKQGDEDDLMEKLWLPIKLLNHPRIVALLKNSADEFGFRQQGLLKIVTQDVHLFKVVDMLNAAVCRHHADPIAKEFKKSKMSMSSCSCSCSSSSVKIRKGYVPVIIVAKQLVDHDYEQTSEKVWIPIKLMNHPRIVALLKDQADEFGYHQQSLGLLKIRYDVHLFKDFPETNTLQCALSVNEFEDFEVTEVDGTILWDLLEELENQEKKKSDKSELIDHEPNNMMTNAEEVSMEKNESSIPDSNSKWVTMEDMMVQTDPLREIEGWFTDDMVGMTDFGYTVGASSNEVTYNCLWEES